MKKTESIDSYISGFPAPVQKVLKRLRRTIQNQAPAAVEKISYGIPTFYLNGNLVHFAGYKSHIGFYPGGAAIEKFKPRFNAYKTSKGAVQFPIDAVPDELVVEIVRARVAEQTPADPFDGIAAPARRALEAAKITSLARLSKFSKEQVAGMHGVGPRAVKQLSEALGSAGLSFKAAAPAKKSRK